MSKLFEPKFGSVRTKCESIITGVTAPIARDELHNELKECNFLSTSTDTSNRHDLKLAPIVVRNLHRAAPAPWVSRTRISKRNPNPVLSGLVISRDSSREADPETVLATGQTAEKRLVKIRTVRPQMTGRARTRSPPLSMATPPTYEDSRKVNLNLFQELSSDEADGYSTVDDKSERDEDFKLPRSEKKKERSKEKREEKKKKSNEKNKSEEKKKDKENPEVEAMEEEVLDKAGRGATKRARTAKIESEDEKSAKEELAAMRELLKKLNTQKEEDASTVSANSSQKMVFQYGIDENENADQAAKQACLHTGTCKIQNHVQFNQLLPPSPCPK
uniref:Pre-mRNA-splicing factor 38B-like n=1 Tax=Diabrotica virgifera virgifera TaxID=50390 RepID=A0A6P7GGG9_DIAVI